MRFFAVYSVVRSFVSSSYLRRIFASSYLRIFVSSYLRIFVSSYLRIFVSSYLRIFVSSYLRIFLSSHLRIFVSSFLRFLASWLLRLLHYFACLFDPHSFISLYVCPFIPYFLSSFFRPCLRLLVCSFPRLLAH